jgi:transposase InsO family protein
MCFTSLSTLGPGRRHVDLRSTRGAGTRRHRSPARATPGHDRQRQRHRADLNRRPELGRTRPVSSGITSHPASLSRTASSRASTAGAGQAAERDAVPSLLHARAMPEAWRREYNEERPHSKLDWMTPRAYAIALGGDAGRGAALRQGSAPRPLATHKTESSNQPRTPDGERRGSPQRNPCF